MRLATVEDRIDADLESGRHGQLVAELEALVRQSPLRERPRAQLMLALYRAGRQADALESYQSGRRALVNELGIEPGRALQELETAILRHDTALEPPGQARVDDHAAAGEYQEPGADAGLSGEVFVGRVRHANSCQAVPQETFE